jgi:hypothetical protein
MMSKIEEIMRIIVFDHLDMMTYLEEARSPAHKSKPTEPRGIERLL